jgi:hypothetical protein
MSTAQDQDRMEEIARQVRAALQEADLTGYKELLDPNVTWGAPDDASSGCHNRDQVLTWYRRGRAAGVEAEVTETLVHGDRILVGLTVVGNRAGEEPAGSADRWQVLTVGAGLINDIRGFDDRTQAVEWMDRTPRR